MSVSILPSSTQDLRRTNMQASQSTSQSSLYGYTPTLWVCITFLALFSIATLIHTALAHRYRLWWLYPTIVLAGLGEVLGWTGRLWSNRNIGNYNAYIMQITTTIIAPTPFTAANFIILGALIRYLGPQYSRLTPKWYAIVFCAGDGIALIIQAVGGATASEAFQNGNDPTTGGNVMLGGIAIQMFAISIYAALGAEFILRWKRDRPIRNGEATQPPASEIPDRNVKLTIFALGFSTLLVFIRSVYRVIELADGWEGRIIHTQEYFNWLDGAMILLALYTMIFFHPGILLLPILKKRRGPPQDAESSRGTSEDIIEDKKKCPFAGRGD